MIASFNICYTYGRIEPSDKPTNEYGAIFQFDTDALAATKMSVRTAH